MIDTRPDNAVPLTDLFGTARLAGVPDIRVSDITADSSRVQDGGLFLACRGYNHHGLEFADQAVSRGAAVIAWEPEEGLQEPDLPSTVHSLQVPGLSDEIGGIADRFFARPSEQLTVMGVTGTNGKTTTAWLVSQALQRMGCPAGYMGTLGFGVGGQLQPSQLTTPGVIAVHRRLRSLADAGARAVIMEVSSHALDQGRIDGVRVATAAFTNLSRDHLDYHGDMGRYGQAKAKLFLRDSLRHAVINVGDAFGVELSQQCGEQTQVMRVSLEGCASGSQLVAEVSSAGTDGLILSFSGDYGSAKMRSPLWGRFNAENILVAAGILLTQGYELAAVVAALGQCEAPAGRMQVLKGAADAPRVIVDFAHTPDALTQALGVIKEHCGGSLTVVFGCGGERDKGKRGEMGQAASRLANRIIVTDDNPRSDDPDGIVADILAGVSGDAEVLVERDRAAAINRAVWSSNAGDVVLVAGKGSENYQLIGRETFAFSDAEVASAALRVAT